MSMKSFINNGFNEETLNGLKKIYIREFDNNPTLFL